LLPGEEEAAMSCTQSSRPQEVCSLPEAEMLRQLRQLRQLRSLCFGQVTAMIHDGRIVQIERTERLRFGNRQQTLAKET
jgi:hypothetical protein